MAAPQLHTAPWVVPVAEPVLADGGIVVHQGVVLAVGAAAALRQQFPEARQIHHPQAALTPALINAHIHLELSHLAELSAVPLTSSFTGWITEQLELRSHFGSGGPEIEAAAKKLLHAQYLTGVSVVADIGNTALNQQLVATFPGLLMAYKEYLGLAAFTLEKNLQRLAAEPASVRCAGHAPYSTHPQLLLALKERARHHNQVWPIHVAEPAAENDMLSQGNGEMVDFVRRRGFWDGSFQPQGRPGSIRYLDSLQVLDERTLCVHAVHVDDEEIQIIKRKKVKICLCPGSNQYLQVGLAPVDRYLDAGLLPALGTDSIASNPELSLWREMALLAESFPKIPAASIFAMATRGGAEALNVAEHWGALAPGKRADILEVVLPGQMNTADQLMQYLVTASTSIYPNRITCEGGE